MLGFSPLAGAPLADDAGVASQNVTVLVTGVSATGAVGTLVDSIELEESTSELLLESGYRIAMEQNDSVAGGASTAATGVSATGAVGSVSVSVVANVNVSPLGVSATAALGEAAASTVTYAPVTGVSATGIVGTVSVRTATGVQPIGVFATGRVGHATVWGRVVPSSAPFWRTVDTLVDSIELEESTNEILLESGYRIAMEQDEDAAWVSVSPPSGDIWRPVAA